MKHRLVRLLAFTIFALAVVPACGDDDGATGDDDDTDIDSGGGDDDGDGGGDLTDSGVPGIDAIGPSGCVPGGSECSDCDDNDGDGRIDGYDPECISAADDDESSFATGIPGDNMDPNKQDCFFDGDSGAGNDGCELDTCCLLDECGDGGACEISKECIATCGGVTVPGCDCFGCCTICDSTLDPECYTVHTHPQVAPDCTYQEIDNPELCPPCTPVADCGTPCDPEGCILCPGQTPDDLPDSCGEQQECPDGSATCTSNDDCESNQFCTNGCCINQIG
jgi:hypothetical protein